MGDCGLERAATSFYMKCTTLYMNQHLGSKSVFHRATSYEITRKHRNFLREPIDFFS